MIRAVLRDLASGPIAGQMRRFVVGGALTAGLQMALLWLFVDIAELNLYVGATVAIEITIVCSYVLNNAWTFRATRNTGVADYLSGLLKTNLVRGTAIPIQLGVLAALVRWVGVMYLVANAVAILVSGVYRFVLDSQWTWG
ncbi:GtrA family protein [Halorubrum sodomense]|uniref:Putative flippase GtrA (Transmembrane translocase of bactoprenol-linked glucose) n=1 Tax=Halorubrum sodomense TaxID=35743 RepID=A0A1I6HRX3_HALSD|nr:GtrA family protein [Halorubrum sodomense]SFR57174.1 Putative flippase GtrA (transmembrane translocase of bactoprenol-linked glucose) [Halorubrum sodomense]